MLGAMRDTSSFPKQRELKGPNSAKKTATREKGSLGELGASGRIHEPLTPPSMLALLIIDIH